MSKPHLEGRRAHDLGHHVHDNPYTQLDYRRVAWRAGWFSKHDEEK